AVTCDGGNHGRQRLAGLFDQSLSFASGWHDRLLKKRPSKSPWNAQGVASSLPPVSRQWPDPSVRYGIGRGIPPESLSVAARRVERPVAHAGVSPRVGR